MEKGILALFFIILALPIALAENTANYQIVDNDVLIDLDFSSVTSLELKIPFDAKALEVNTNYELKDFSSYKILKVNSTENLKIKYITSTLIEKSSRGYFFILNRPASEKMNITLYLPEGAVLVDADESIVIPSSDKISTDGRRIVLKWNNFDDEQIIVSYEFINKSSKIYYLLITILVILSILVYYFQSARFKQRIKSLVERRRVGKGKRKDIIKEDLTKNLFEDEKRIVEYLLTKKDNESWTKEIIKGVGISKVKLSRKLRSLEQKEIIKRIPYGNENKIRLIAKK